MSEIINLNKARKAKIKQSQMAQAVENRVRFGVTTRDRKTETVRLKKEAKKLDGHVLVNGSFKKKVDDSQ